MSERINLPLFLLDFLILLPVTMLRLFLIYIYGSRYRIPGLNFLDVMIHADQPKFNQDQVETKNSIDTESRSVKQVIRETLTETEPTPYHTIDTQRLLSTESSRPASVRVGPMKPVVATDSAKTKKPKTRKPTDLEKRISMLLSNSTTSKKSRSKTEKTDRSSSSNIFARQDEKHDTERSFALEDSDSEIEIEYGNRRSLEPIEKADSDKSEYVHGSSTARRINIMFTDHA